jgi:hypothetical protein
MNGFDRYLTPEQVLWRAVLTQAVYDANKDPDRLCNAADRRACHASRQWLTDGGSDFRMVCDLAGIDPPFFRDAVRAGRLDDFRASKRQPMGAA